MKMELDRLITQVVQKARAIRSDISKLQELRFPSDNPRRLASLINNITQAIEDEILSRYRVGPPSEEDFRRDVKLSVQALHILGAHLRYIERATTTQTPWSLVRSLEKVAEQLHRGSCFVIRPQWRYNYSLLELTTFYRKAFFQLLEDRFDKALKLALSDSINRLYVIGFPYIDRLSVLMHTLLGHELGHPIEEEYLEEEIEEEFIKKQRYQKQLPPFVEEMYQAVLRELKVPPNSEALDLQATARVSKMLECVITLRRRALEELICDLTSVNLFGPAALFATEEFALSRELDAIEKELPEHHYPPWRYRLRAMRQELTSEWVQRFIQEGQFTEEEVSHHLRAKLDSVGVLIEQDTDKQAINRIPEARIAYESVEEALPKVRNFVKQRLERRGIRLDDLIGRVNTQLLQRLEDWIPPDAYVDEDNEIISDMRSILNIGWLRWIRKYAAVPSGIKTSKDIDEYFVEVDVLNRLVLKAIEYADLRSVWHQKQQQKEGRNASTGA